MAISNSDYVKRIFNAILLRDPTDDENTRWVTELDQNLTTPAGLVLLGAETTEFLTISLPLAQIYLSAFGSMPDREELLFWGNIYRTGASLSQIAETFLASDEFAKQGELSTEEKIALLYKNATGGTISSSLQTAYLNALEEGTMTTGEVVMQIAAQGDALQSGLGMVYAALFDKSPESSDLSSLSNDTRTAVAELFEKFAEQNTTTEPEPPTGTYESEGKLVLEETLTGDLIIDLQSLAISKDDTAVTITSGSLSNVTQTDARSLLKAVITYTGTGNADIFYASDAGNTIRGYDGNDAFTLNSGVDTVIFETDSSANGQDTITNFKIGTGGDKLDFSNLLNVPDAQNAIVTATAGSGNVGWDNGDILVVNGFSLDSTTEIATLFTDGTFTAPTASSKSVVISADIVGDASIWLVVNQTETTSIEAAEVSKIATLTGVNNLALQPFTSDNFVLPVSTTEDTTA